MRVCAMMNEFENEKLLHAFMRAGQVDIAPGGAPETSWWKRKLLAFLLGVGLLAGISFFHPASASDKGENRFTRTFTSEAYKNHIRGLQDKVDRVKQARTVIVLDREEAGQASGTHPVLAIAVNITSKFAPGVPNPLNITKADHINTMIAAGLLERGKILRNLSVGTDIALHVDDTNCWAFKRPINPASPALDLGVVLPVHSTATLKGEASLYADLSASETLRADLPMELEDIASFTGYHEALGHCTEPDAGLASPLSYNRHLQELRADIAATVAHACEHGDTNIGRTMSNLRDTATPKAMLYCAAKMENTDIYHHYAIGAETKMATLEIDRILARPEWRKEFMAMDEAAMKAETDRIFNQVKPSEALYNTRCRRLEAWARDTLQPYRPDPAKTSPLRPLLNLLGTSDTTPEVPKTMNLQDRTLARRFDSARAAVVAGEKDKYEKMWKKATFTPLLPTPSPTMGRK